MIEREAEPVLAIEDPRDHQIPQHKTHFTDCGLILKQLIYVHVYVP